MPSPIAATSSQQLQTPPLPQDASTSGEGAVQSPDVPFLVDGPDATLHDTASTPIQEKKDTAKAVLAGSGINIGAAPGETPTPHSQNAASAPTGSVNGAPSSRKRSRSGSRKPSPSPAQDQYHLDKLSQKARYSRRDAFSSAAMTAQYRRTEEMLAELKEECIYYRDEIGRIRQTDPGAIFGYGYMGYGNGLTDTKGPARLQYPIQAKRPGNRRARPLRMSTKDKAAQAEQIEELVPLRLDIELEKIKLRDTFTWNLHDRVTPVDIFAENLVEDFRLPMELRGQLIQHIHREMQEQINDFYPHAFIEEEPLDPHLPYSAYKNDEMRILIKLNITIGQHTLVDQFEWEMNDPQNSPEEFARQMARDLSLSGEFTTAIAHSIREQCQMFTKSLYITGHPFDGRPVEDTDIRDSFLPSPLPSVFRPMQSAKDYTPYLYELSEQELERTEFSILREQRRQKRSVNRRGGPALPDLKDRQRTVRTLVVSSVLPGAAETIEESHMFKVSRSSKTRSRPGRGEGGDSSEESDSGESLPESPAPSQITSGTARTRGLRGAANAAQAAIKSAIGRSATPEISSLHAHETRTSARQLRYENREESVSEPSTLIVKLRISPKKLREYLQNAKAFVKAVSSPASAPTSAVKNTPGTNPMPPPPSPAMPPRSTPANGAQSIDASPRVPSTPTPTPQSQSQQKWNYHQDGRVDAPYPLQPGTAPAPPPPWLRNALANLHERYPNDLFEATMRYSIVDQNTQQTIKVDQFNQNTSLPAGYKAQYLPRIRCNDCPGKLYTAGPERTVENFEVHLKNRQHKASVERRTGKSSSS
ncbi:SNF5-domain-containing protein [Lojkania enalia]|uniref:SNF5-domain-containing protein n=1 Tax=Lojkania enalia TaxID=147567 RepID=A0A9P4KJE6_9PLEO|nr:SNF5-domain-containing protein [Didymosphaeria enalia]